MIFFSSMDRKKILLKGQSREIMVCFFGLIG